MPQNCTQAHKKNSPKNASCETEENDILSHDKGIDVNSQNEINHASSVFLRNVSSDTHTKTFILRLSTYSNESTKIIILNITPQGLCLK